ncbi:MAG: patatin-like phospholipase family protein [Clostridium perfringens]|nr:patatin-like phospholipase family protein [Clostridium perfringens]
MYVDIVCEGGGVKGIALVGSINCLENYGYTFKKIAGTSAGAIIASLLAVGYSGEELKNIVLNLDYSKLIFNTKLNKFLSTLKGGVNIFIKKGLYSSQNIENYLSGLFAAKGKTKFKDISINNQSPLKIIASDITNKKLLILPDDLTFYGIDPMEFQISKAVIMSINIPFYFTPYILRCNNEKNFIVDGGLLSNFPIWLFDTKEVPLWPTFGLRLKEDDSFQLKKRYSLFSYISDIIHTAFSHNEDIYLENKDAIRTIDLPTLSIKSTNFNLNNSEVLTLYKSGYKTTENFINSWSFDYYINRYRKS